VIRRRRNKKRLVKTVDEYHEEMEIAMIHGKVVENKEATMDRFLNVMNRDIANVVELQHYMELEDMIYIATKVERYEDKS